jgi:hypothetical protein
LILASEKSLPSSNSRFKRKCSHPISEDVGSRESKAAEVSMQGRVFERLGVMFDILKSEKEWFDDCVDEEITII